MSDVAVKTARMPGEEHSDRNTAKVETDRFQGDGHHARFPHLVTEAGSIVLHVSNSMNEIKKDDEDSEDGEEECGTAAGRENDEISRKDAHQKMYQRQEKSEKTTRNPPKNSQTSKLSATSQESILQKKKVLITKIKNERGENITSRKGIANVFGEFYKKLYDDNEQDETEQEIGENKNENSIDVHNNNTNEMTRIPEITTEELQDAIRKLKQVNHQTATGSEPKTSKHATRRREMVRQIFNEIKRQNEFTPEAWKKVKIKVIH